MQKIDKKYKYLNISKSVLIHILMYTLAILTIMPFIWMILTSVKDMSEIFVYPPQWFPEEIKFQNYIDAFNAAPFGTFYMNSLIVALSVTLGQLITCSMAAYAFARLEFKGRDIIFYIFLGTMMIPANVTMIPTYIVLSTFGLIDSLYSLIIPGLASAFGTFLLRQFFMTIPKELEEAAYIDGASKWQVLLRVIIPLSKPALATLAIFTFMGVFNDFIWALICINSEELKTVQLGLATFRDKYLTQWDLLMAGSVTATLPILIIFFVAQKYFIQGITLSGLKE
ncbi:MAG: carbohydrate ABC transporter permease [Ignavibacteriaceae bacterium]|jgi:multiple sugar transport system permease protein|nr:carbohydrate ABC transporter permease [Ignavibacteriaceae bacterium]